MNISKTLFVSSLFEYKHYNTLILLLYYER